MKIDEPPTPYNRDYDSADDEADDEDEIEKGKEEKAAIVNADNANHANARSVKIPCRECLCAYRFGSFVLTSLFNELMVQLLILSLSLSLASLLSSLSGVVLARYKPISIKSAWPSRKARPSHSAGGHASPATKTRQERTRQMEHRVSGRKGEESPHTHTYITYHAHLHTHTHTHHTQQYYYTHIYDTHTAHISYRAHLHTTQHFITYYCYALYIYTTTQHI